MGACTATDFPQNLTVAGAWFRLSWLSINEDAMWAVSFFKSVLASKQTRDEWVFVFSLDLDSDNIGEDERKQNSRNKAAWYLDATDTPSYQGWYELVLQRYFCQTISKAISDSEADSQLDSQVCSSICSSIQDQKLDSQVCSSIRSSIQDQKLNSQTWSSIRSLILRFEFTVLIHNRPRPTSLARLGDNGIV